MTVKLLPDGEKMISELITGAARLVLS
jgi:hypothetical protein